jgi:CBS domain containing-hemolysin-like protein
MRPAIWVLNGTANALLRLIGLGPANESEHAHSQDELRLLLSSSAAQGVLDPIEGELASRSLALGQLTVRDLMVPRTKVDALPADIGRAEAQRRMVGTGRPRLPVYKRTIDDVVGVVEWSLLFRSDAEGWTEEIEAIFVLPESMAATLALGRMRERPAPEALIVDEYGGTAGLLTMSALVHELAGRRDVLALPATVAGNTPVHVLERALTMTFPRTEAATVGGVVGERLGRLPSLGDSIEVDRYRFTIEAADGHQILWVGVVRS